MERNARTRDPYGDRVVTSFQVSIGTGLLLETLFDPTTDRYDAKRKIPQRVDVDDYEVHYYNIYTLGRNILSALDRSVREKLVSDGKILEVIYREMDIIGQLYVDKKCKVRLYAPDYDKVYKRLQGGKEYEVDNDSYLHYKVIKKELDKGNGLPPVDVVLNVDRLPVPEDTNSKILITTHFAVDLLNVKYIKNLELLDSHTGIRSIQKEWYKKYHEIGKRDMSIFRFTERLLYVLGDKHMIRPLNSDGSRLGILLRRTIHNLFLEKKMNSAKSETMADSMLRNLHKEYADIKKYKRYYI